MAVSQLELSEGSSSERILAAAGVAAFAASSAAVWYFDPTTAGFFPVCPLYSMTGIACPGCGLTRGFHALFHGDVTTALHFNALIPLFAMIFAFFLMRTLLFAVRGTRLPKWIVAPRLLTAFFVLLLVFGVLRNLPFYPFTFLYP